MQEGVSGREVPPPKYHASTGYINLFYTILLVMPCSSVWKATYQARKKQLFPRLSHHFSFCKIFKS